MLIQFAINKDRYDEEDDEEEDDDDGTLPEETRKPAGRDRRGNSREYTSDRNRDDHRYTYENRANDDRKAGVKDVPADHLTEKDATLTDEKEIMQTAEKIRKRKKQQRQFH